MFIAVFVTIILTSFIQDVKCHGRLILPPSRSSMWRYGFDTPRNYNDNELFCGGFAHQQSLGGKCGTCGDAFDAEVRQNEAGGLYATGTISRVYSQGALIDVEVEITADHKGWFEFKLCPNNDYTVAATPECFEDHKLLVNGGAKYYLPLGGVTKIHKLTVQLPAETICSQCVFQWRYHTGNNWGCDDDGVCGSGHGPQEEFYGCSDITIEQSATGKTQEPTTKLQPSPSTTMSSTTETSTKASTTVAPGQTVLSTVLGLSTTTKASTTSLNSGTDKICKADNEWKGQAAMDDWCVTNCAAGYCPSSHCKCDVINMAATITTTTTSTQNTCKAANAWKGQAAMDNWCVTNCAAGYCPSSHCKC